MSDFYQQSRLFHWMKFLLMLVLMAAMADGIAGIATFTVEGRPYVAFADVAVAQGLTPVQAAGPKQIQAGSGQTFVRVETDSREAMINGVRYWLGFPARMVDGKMSVAEVDLVKTILPALKPKSVEGLRPFRTVVLDAGHGGHDRGGISKLGVEKDFALDLTRRVRDGLKKAGLKVVMTRDKDAFIALEARPRVANAIPDSIFVSLHFNSAEWRPAARGVEMYSLPPRGVPPAGQDKAMARDAKEEAGHAREPQSFVLSQLIQRSILGAMKMEDRGVKRARFSVLRGAKVPAVLVEGGFLSNSEEAKNIASPAWREKLAQSIVAGILEFRKLASE